ncbi:MAG TPA: CDP-alcohol phosphatidyltransferase family protein [Nocardioidaceae bacterium]|nr:CDP-alcohol phosphatidyltransferase family protein [Nocardioidaceae bacterium]
MTLRSGLAVGLVAQVALLAALATTVGLTGFGWLVGIVCGVVMVASVDRGMVRTGTDTFGPADLVTLIRATLACAVAALVADSFLGQAAVTALVTLAAAGLVLDAVDGWVARRTRTTSAFGARFDGEVDAFLILVLSVYVAGSAGGWVLAIGAMRYAFAAAGWGMPWLRRKLPPRYWRKVVAATQGIVLTVAAADVVPHALMTALLVVALALLVESFGRDVWWSWRHRDLERVGSNERAEQVEQAERSERTPRIGPRGRAVAGVVLNGLALLLVWFALVVPDQAQKVTPGAFFRIPVEGLVVAGLALVLPALARRAMTLLVGLLLGLVALLKVLDMGFFAALDRPFNLVTDRSYFSPVRVLVRDAIGPVAGDIVLATAVVLALAILVFMPLSLGRLAALVARHRTRSLRTLMALAVIWVTCAAFGLQTQGGEPIASANAGGLAVEQVRAMTAAVQDRQEFDEAAATDRFHDTTDVKLLTGLRGKDVLIAFVESYGRIAIEGSPSSPQIQHLLDDGTTRLRAAGYSSQSAFLTSPTFGGLSWLAHSTLQTGLWVSDQGRYDRLLEGNRVSLSRLFKRAGWRTVAMMPANREEWPEGRAFYDFDTIYDRDAIDYHGPRFGFSLMPDQYALSAFQRLELADRHHTPVMAQIELASSHAPWAPLPEMVDWDRLGDGSVFDEVREDAQSATELWRHPEDVEPEYIKSIAYCLSTLISFVEEYGDDDLVLIVVGDHQPATVVSGHGASRDVPISVIAHDPTVLDRISGWGWQDGLRPAPEAPVWRMDAFRDRFLAAYSRGAPVVP